MSWFTPDGYRRIVPLTGGRFRGPEMSGTLLPGASADWQILRPDGTALGDIRYTLQTDRGELLSVRSRSVRHGPADVLARLARGEDVDPHEYTFRASTRIETAALGLDWLNKGIFVSVGKVQNHSTIALTGTPTNGSYTFNGQSYAADSVGNLIGARYAAAAPQFHEGAGRRVECSAGRLA